MANRPHILSADAMLRGLCTSCLVLVENYASRAVMNENERDLRINIGAEGPQRLLDIIAILTRIGSSVTVSNGDLAVR